MGFGSSFAIQGPPFKHRSPVTAVTGAIRPRSRSFLQTGNSNLPHARHPKLAEICRNARTEQTQSFPVAKAEAAGSKYSILESPWPAGRLRALHVVRGRQGVGWALVLTDGLECPKGEESDSALSPRKGAGRGSVSVLAAARPGLRACVSTHAFQNLCATYCCI